MLRRRMKQLEDELAIETVTSVEFEETSRRSFKYLEGQVKTVHKGLAALTEALLDELETMGSNIRGDMLRLEEKQRQSQETWFREVGEIALREGQFATDLSNLRAVLPTLDDSLRGKIDAAVEDAVRAKMDSAGDLCIIEDLMRERMEALFQNLSQDVSAMLGVIPKMEDSLRERLGATMRGIADVGSMVASDRTRTVEAMERLEAKLKSLEADLQESWEQRHLKLQRSVSRQMESMSRLLVGDAPFSDMGARGGRTGTRQVDIDPSVFEATGQPTSTRPVHFEGTGHVSCLRPCDVLLKDHAPRSRAAASGQE